VNVQQQTCICSQKDDTFCESWMSQNISAGKLMLPVDACVRCLYASVHNKFQLSSRHLCTSFCYQQLADLKFTKGTD